MVQSLALGRGTGTSSFFFGDAREAIAAPISAEGPSLAHQIAGVAQTVKPYSSEVASSRIVKPGGTSFVSSAL